MKIEVAKKPRRLSKSNAHWLEVSKSFFALQDDECLKIKGLTFKEINSLRQQAYREADARAFIRREGFRKEPVLYLHKKNER